MVEYMIRNRMLSRGASYLAAVSGGIDSVVLAHALGELRHSWGISLHLVYVNHQLRDAAGEEAGFVRALGDSMRVSSHVIEVDVRAARESQGGSIQEIARTLRYDVLERLRLEMRLDFTATAHHAGDQAETLLGHFLSGSGPSGLAGIRPVLGAVIRPLLFAGKASIEEYAAENGLAWKEDASNSERYYTRNRLRIDVIPVVKEAVNPSLEKTLLRTADLFRKIDEFLNSHTQRLYKEAVREAGGRFYLADEKLKGYFEAEAMLVVKHSLERAGCTRVSDIHVEQALSLLNKQSGTRIELPGNLEAVRERGGIVICETASNDPEAVSIALGESIEWQGLRIRSRLVQPVDVAFSRDGSVEYADADTLGDSWTLRRWQPGDGFQPLGFRGRTLVSDYLNGAGIASSRKQEACVLVHAGEIVWLCGYRLDDRVKLREETARIAELCIEPIHQIEH